MPASCCCRNLPTLESRTGLNRSVGGSFDNEGPMTSCLCLFKSLRRLRPLQTSPGCFQMPSGILWISLALRPWCSDSSHQGTSRASLFDLLSRAPPNICCALIFTISHYTACLESASACCDVLRVTKGHGWVLRLQFRSVLVASPPPKFPAPASASDSQVRLSISHTVSGQSSNRRVLQRKIPLSRPQA